MRFSWLSLLYLRYNTRLLINYSNKKRPSTLSEMFNIILITLLILKGVMGSFNWVSDFESLQEDIGNNFTDLINGDVITVGRQLLNNELIYFQVAVDGTSQLDNYLAIKAAHSATIKHLHGVGYVDSLFFKGNGQYVGDNATRNKAKREDTPDPESFTKKSLHVVVKYGQHQVGSAITQFISDLVSTPIEKWIGELVLGVGANSECGSAGMLIPMGKSWQNAKAYVAIETCRTGGKSCKTTALEDLIRAGAYWANNAIDSHPKRDTYKVGFSHSGYWHMCIRYAVKDYYKDYESCKSAAKEMGCPKGYCDNGQFEKFDHDEL